MFISKYPTFAYPDQTSDKNLFCVRTIGPVYPSPFLSTRKSTIPLHPPLYVHNINGWPLDFLAENIIFYISRANNRIPGIYSLG